MGQLPSAPVRKPGTGRHRPHSGRHKAEHLPLEGRRMEPAEQPGRQYGNVEPAHRDAGHQLPKRAPHHRLQQPPLPQGGTPAGQHSTRCEVPHRWQGGHICRRGAEDLTQKGRGPQGVLERVPSHQGHEDQRPPRAHRRRGTGMDVRRHAPPDMLPARCWPAPGKDGHTAAQEQQHHLHTGILRAARP